MAESACAQFFALRPKRISSKKTHRYFRMTEQFFDLLIMIEPISHDTHFQFTIFQTADLPKSKNRHKFSETVSPSDGVRGALLKKKARLPLAGPGRSAGCDTQLWGDGVRRRGRRPVLGGVDRRLAPQKKNTPEIKGFPGSRNREASRLGGRRIRGKPGTLRNERKGHWALSSPRSAEAARVAVVALQQPPPLSALLGGNF